MNTADKKLKAPTVAAAGTLVNTQYTPILTAAQKISNGSLIAMRLNRGAATRGMETARFDGRSIARRKARALRKRGGV